MRQLSAAQVAQLSREEFLRHRLRQIEGDITSARKAESFQALATLHRQSMACQAELEALVRVAQAPVADPLSTASPEELIDALLKTVAELPPRAVERLADAVSLRLTGRPTLRAVQA